MGHRLRLLPLALAALLAAERAFANIARSGEDAPPAGAGWTAFESCVGACFPPRPSYPKRRVVRGASLSLIEGGEWVDGVAVAPLTWRDGVRGAQLGVFALSGRMTGVQMGGYTSTDRLRGAQLGLVNQADDMAAKGLQFGLLNSGDLTGAQVGLFNTGEPRGAQLGVINSAVTARGLQLGLYNSAYVLHGAQIGLINVSGTVGKRRWRPFVNARL